MSKPPNSRFSGCALFILWTLLLIAFMTVVGAVFGFGTELELGYPLWLLIGRLLVVSLLFVTILGLMGRRQWGVYGFFTAAAAMIPLSVAYSYFNLQLTEGLELTLNWIVRNTIVTAVAVMFLVTVVFWALRVQRVE
jgi:hypothetical protein